MRLTHLNLKNQTMQQGPVMKSLRMVARWALSAWLVLTAHAVSAQLVPAQEPVLNRQAAVRPNVTFVLDNSLSMGWSCIYARNVQAAIRAIRPNNVSEGNDVDCLQPTRPAQSVTSWQTTIANGSLTFPSVSRVYFVRTGTAVINPAQLSPVTNLLMYNPAVRYEPAFSNSGVQLPNATLTSATFHSQTFYLPKAGEDIPSLTTFAAINNGSRYTRYHVRWTTSATGTAFSTSTGTTTALATSGAWTSVNPIPKPSARTDCVAVAAYCTAREEQQNIANWRAYHFDRMATSKTGVGKAFSQQQDTFRLNWSSIANQSSIAPGTCTAAAPTSCGYAVPALLPVKDYFLAKTDFFTWLNAFDIYNVASPAPNGYSFGTNLRNTLDIIGTDYMRSDNAGPWGSTPWSPPSATAEPATSHLSCRRSFAILTTDGVWNDRRTPTVALGIDVDGTDGPIIAHASGDSAKTYQYRPRTSDPRNIGKADNPVAGGTNATLADVALHYWRTDLRSGSTTGLVNNASPGGPSSPPFWQNLTTYSVGIGVFPTMTDAQISAARSGSLSWATPTYQALQNVDDLIHAAHNGGGEYLSVQDATSFAEKLGNAMNSIAGQQFSQAGVAASAVVLQAGTKKFVPYYTTGKWWGNMQMIGLDEDGNEDSTVWKVVSTGANGEPTGTTTFPLPSARNLWVWKDAASRGIAFDSNILLPASGLSTLLDASVNASMIDFLRGNRTNEGDGKPFRQRATILGDIVNSTPVFVKNNTNFRYELLPSATPGLGSYTAYMASKAARTEGVLFVGANDGMLHGFREGTPANGGAEVFGYVPKSVLGNIHLLASKTYSHRYFVDGPLTEADAYVVPGLTGTATWTNMLLGSTGAGAKTIFALNVTDPLNMNGTKIMWEISKTSGGSFDNLGHVLTPIQHGIMRDGTWVAIFGNGYDSASGTASLYIVNLATGALIKEIGTDTDTGNGLGGVRLVHNANREIIGAYAGDLRGRLWKFDFNSTSQSSWGLGLSGSPLFTAVGPTGVRQPITAQPAVIERTDVSSYNPSYMVVVGTGKLFASTDPTDTNPQTAYGLWDRRAFGVALSDPISSTTTLVRIDVAVTGSVSTAFTSADGVDVSEITRFYNTTASRTVDWTVDRGWYLPLNIVSGQRVIYSAEILGRVVRVDTVAPRLTANTCEQSASEGYNLLIDPLSGTCKAQTTLDTNGDGAIDDSDSQSCIYSTLADGQDVVLQIQGSSELADIQDSLGHITIRPGCAGAGCSTPPSPPPVTGGSGTAPIRAWRRLFLR